MVDCVKDLRKVQVDDVHSSSLGHCCSHSTIQGHKDAQPGLALGGALLALSNNLSVLHIP